MKLITKGLVLSLLVSTGLMAVEKITPVTTPKTAVSQINDVKVFKSDNADGKITAKSVEEAFQKAGFVIGADNDMNFPFKRDFNQTSFDYYNLMVIFRKETTLALAQKYPEIGLFTPMSLSIWCKKGDKTISVSSLKASTMAKIMGIPEDNPAMVALGKKVEEVLRKAMPKGKFIELPYKMKAPTKDIITRVSFEQKGDDWEEAKDNFETAFEEKLAPNGFVMAGFTDVNYDLDEHDKDWYLFYDVYSICKISVIYEVAKLHPEAGAFAPCSAYKYQKKGEKTVHMAFPNVYKWIASLNIEDKASIDVLLDAQKKFENMLTEITK
jgi:uncharacterized protein (DUF302 family)